MKPSFLQLTLTLCLIGAGSIFAQNNNQVLKLFPEGTVLHGNIPYNNDTLKKHLLDIYLPASVKGKIPLVVFIYGGGWLSAAGVPSELTIVPNAPHFGKMLDTEEYKIKVINSLEAAFY